MRFNEDDIHQHIGVVSGAAGKALNYVSRTEAAYLYRSIPSRSISDTWEQLYVFLLQFSQLFYTVSKVLGNYKIWKNKELAINILTVVKYLSCSGDKFEGEKFLFLIFTKLMLWIWTLYLTTAQ